MALILIRTDLGAGPDTVARRRYDPILHFSGGERHEDAANLTDTVGQTLHSARISDEPRTADTATVCQTLQANGPTPERGYRLRY